MSDPIDPKAIDPRPIDPRPIDPEPIDGESLDQYLKGGSLVSQRYRELDADQVPPDLDQRVLAQARAAVVKRPAAKSRNWIRWSAPLALAASLVMVVTIVIESGVQKETLLTAEKPTADVGGVRNETEREEKQVSGVVHFETQMVDAPPPPAAPKSQTPAVTSPGVDPAFAPPEEVVTTERRSRAEPQYSVAPITAVEAPVLEESVVSVEAAPAQAVSSSATVVQQTTAVPTDQAAKRQAPGRADSSYDQMSDALSEVAVTGSRVRRAPAPTAGPRNTIPQSTARQADEPDRSEARKYYDPERWLAEIRKLRKKGQTAEADLEWEEFVQAFPEYAVAEDDVARKKD